MSPSPSLSLSLSKLFFLDITTPPFVWALIRAALALNAVLERFPADIHSFCPFSGSLTCTRPSTPPQLWIFKEHLLKIQGEWDGFLLTPLLHLCLKTQPLFLLNYSWRTSRFHLSICLSINHIYLFVFLSQLLLFYFSVRPFCLSLSLSLSVSVNFRPACFVTSVDTVLYVTVFDVLIFRGSSRLTCFPLSAFRRLYLLN